MTSSGVLNRRRGDTSPPVGGASPDAPDHGTHAAIAYRPDIDGLRAVAVALVVLFHARIGLFPGGFVGVDIFFVISGFLITSIVRSEIAAGTFSILRFYDRRIRRIFPALFLMGFGAAAIGWFVLSPQDYRSFAASLMAAGAFYSNFFFARQAGYFAPAAESMPLLHTWSLGVEEQFYLLAPLVLLLLSGRRSRWLAPALGALFLVSLVVSTLGVRWEENWAFYMLHARAFELIAGVGLAVAPRAWIAALPPAALAAAGVAGAAMMFAAALLYRDATPFPGIAALLPVAGAVLVILAGIGSGGPVTRLLSLRPVVLVGRISYSLYLWHWPLLAYGAYVFGEAFGEAQRIAAIVLAVVLAALSFRLVEQPLRQAAPGRMMPVFAAGAATLLVCLGATEAIKRSGGAPFRLPEAAAAFAAANPTRMDVAGLCTLTPGRDTPAVPLDCTIGAAGPMPPSLLLFGDSHAMAVLRTVSDIAATEGRKGVAVAIGGCPPLLGLADEDRGVFGKCLPAEAVVDEVLSLSPIETVVLVGRWGLYAEGVPSPEEANTNIRRFSQDPDENRRRFAARLRHTVERLSEDGRRVVVLGPVPEMPFNVPSAAIRALMRGETPDLSLPRERYLARQRAVLPVLADVAGLPGVTVVDPAAVLCGDARCAALDGSRSLYADDDHLSALGAARLAPMLEAAIGQGARTVPDGR